MFTVLGSSGFIGSRLAAALRVNGHNLRTPARTDDILSLGELGHVIDCVGITSDFRARPVDTVEAHVGRLLPLLRHAQFQSFLYLSSTRIYRGMVLAQEDCTLEVSSVRQDHLYNLSKLMGEAVCLSAGRENVRVARLANVYGHGMSRKNFLAAVLGEALDGCVGLHTTLESSKDYIAVEDVVAVLPRIATGGRHRIYNVASGRNVAHGELVHWLTSLTGCTVTVAEGAEHVEFPKIPIDLLSREFDFVPQQLDRNLPALIDGFRERMAK